MSTKCFINTNINTNIYCHNNIYNKIIDACQCFSFKTFNLSKDGVAL